MNQRILALAIAGLPLDAERKTGSSEMRIVTPAPSAPMLDAIAYQSDLRFERGEQKRKWRMQTRERRKKGKL